MTTGQDKFLSDEVGMFESGLRFHMNGSKFRWDVFKMAYEMSHPKSLERIMQTSQEIIDWVNNEQKLKLTPQQSENK